MHEDSMETSLVVFVLCLNLWLNKLFSLQCVGEEVSQEMKDAELQAYYYRVFHKILHTSFWIESF